MSCGLPDGALEAYIAEQIFTLPGVTGHEEALSVVLTGSRAIGQHTAGSDVDLEVVCAAEVSDCIQRALLSEGRVTAVTQTLHLAPESGWQRYFGESPGRPHFSIISLEEMKRHFREFDDVRIWIWTNSVILHDSANRVGAVLDAWKGYPRDVLVKKIKYRWTLASYWAIEVYPHHHSCDEDMPAASTALLNAVGELLKFFFLVEGKPFPYTERLFRYADRTRLGREFSDFLLRIAALATGAVWENRGVWARLDEAFRLLCITDESPECRRLEEAAAEAMSQAGVEPEWIAADFANIDELLSGRLGPVP